MAVPARAGVNRASHGGERELGLLDDEQTKAASIKVKLWRRAWVSTPATNRYYSATIGTRHRLPGW